MDRIHHAAVAMAGNSHVQKGCTLLTKEDRAIRCRTPGKRIGREERRAEMELYTRPRLARRIVRRQSRGSGGDESDEERPAHNRKLGNIVYTSESDIQHSKNRKYQDKQDTIISRQQEYM